MKLVCYIKEGHEQLAMLVNDTLYDMDALHPELPSTMSMFLNYWDEYFPLTKVINESIQEGKISLNQGIPFESVALISPVPLPASCREATAFDDSYQYPYCYFTNHHNVQGPGDISCMPDHFERLDFELGVSIVVSSPCRNITAAEAEQYIGGYMIMNGIRTRNNQTATDIANIFGPWLVTPDELEPFMIAGKEGHTGSSYNLTMKCRVNGHQVSESNLADMNWTFAEIMQTCAYGTYLQPGDIIGTGAAMNGCYLDLNKAGKQNDPDYKEQWLQKGDVIDLEIEGLGNLTNTIVADNSDFSLS